jgi:hypothetical protein
MIKQSKMDSAKDQAARQAKAIKERQREMVHSSHQSDHNPHPFAPPYSPPLPLPSPSPLRPKAKTHLPLPPHCLPLRPRSVVRWVRVVRAVPGSTRASGGTRTPPPPAPTTHVRTLNHSFPKACHQADTSIAPFLPPSSLSNGLLAHKAGRIFTFQPHAISPLLCLPLSPALCPLFILETDANRATSPASAYGGESSGPYSSNLPKPAETPNVKAVSKVRQDTTIYM